MTRTRGGEPDVRAFDALRLRLRIPTFTATSVCLGTIAHVAAGGGIPDPAMMLLIVAAVTLTSASLTRRERSLTSIVVAVALVQVGMHVALLVGHEHGKTVVVDTRPAMLMAHLGAVVALAWWLRRGEIAVWRTAVEVWRRHVQLPSILTSSVASLRDLPAAPRRAGLSRALALLTPVRGPPDPT